MALCSALSLPSDLRLLAFSALGSVALVVGLLIIFLVMFGVVVIALVTSLRAMVAESNNHLNRSMATIDRSVRETTRMVAETVGAVIKDTVTETVKSTLMTVTDSLMGKPGVPVEQTGMTPEGDAYDPKWFEREEDEDLGMPGVGDSVWFPRAEGDRDSGSVLGDGESIIPGVPLPDMTGERFSG